MCGRFTLRANLSQVRDAFQVDGGLDLSPRYNIAPTQDVVAVRLNREADQLSVSVKTFAPATAFLRDIGTFVG